MTDIYGPKERSALMARVRTKDTAPERAVRRLIWGLGYRYRLNVRSLPGSPDIVLPRHRKVVFVHGCFWHRHRACRRAALPTTRAQWWRGKLSRNAARDREVRAELKRMGWAQFTIWQCELGQLRRLAKRLQRFMER